MVLVLTNGRPLLLDWFEEHVDAILETWFLGSEAGRAIADVLVGNYNPSGKLSITFPQHQGQIPIYYNHLRTGRPFVKGDANKFLSKYIDGSNDPLYYFGYGLSYTSFTVDNLRLSADKILENDTLVATVTLKNAGKLEGTETVQLYLHDVAAQISRPVKELKGFQKLTLAPGAETEVSFEISKELLSYYNQDGEKVVEPGKFIVYVGTSSREEDLLQAEFVLG
jgi:beta-glucosidase